MTISLADLAEGVYRDLADEEKSVFSTLQVEDFIRGGIAELNRAAPTEIVDDITFTTDPDTGVIIEFTYPTLVNQPYRVEVVRVADGWAEVIPEADMGQTGVTGYVFRRGPDGGFIDLPQWWLQALHSGEFGVRIHGYGSRPLPASVVAPAPSPVIPLSSEEEYSVRAYAKSAGFDMLSHDRGLFAQWQGQTNNTDVSPTQMMQMAQGAKQEWDHQRGLIRVVRRYW